MLKRLVMCGVLAMFCAPMTIVAEEAKPAAGKVDKSAFELYTKKGRTWTHKSVAAGNTSYMKYEVTDVRDDAADYEITMLDSAKKPMPIPATKQTISFKVAEAPKGEAKDAPKVETSEEKCKVEAGEFDCIKTVTEANGAKTTSWTHKKYKGLLVKSETKMGEMTMTMELVEFKE